MPSQSEARRRLAALMDQRRLELRLTWQDVAEHGGVSLRALANARTGGSQIRPLTERGIDAGLRWAPGSVEKVLSGGLPARLEDAPAATRHRAPGARVPLIEEAAADPAVAPLLARVEAEVTEAERLHGPDVPGEKVFSAPRERGVWDNPAYSREQKIALVAVFRTWSAQGAASEETRRIGSAGA